MPRLRNALYAILIECDRFTKEYRLEYGTPIGHDGSVGTAMLDMLRALLLMACLETDSREHAHYTQMVRDVATAAGFDGHRNSVGRL